jgi:DNA polymerase-4
MDARWLFLDMNSFFASCEQQENPQLRGRPVAVAPVGTDSTSCIAASYEAKAFGIKCGTNVGIARALCPDLVVVHGRHGIYSEYHRQIMRLLRGMMPEARKLSVDEVACPLGDGMGAAEAVKLAIKIKRALHERVGECMHCSVGIAPNAFLAKVATELHKPNGLVVIRGDDLPGAVEGLQLRDFPGIGRQMQSRLNRCGILTVADLYAADRRRLRLAWGSILGERWWHMIRGSAVCDYGALSQPETKSVGHSHVLAPELRNPIGAEGVLLRLTERAVYRLRLQGYHARTVTVTVRFLSSNRDDSASWTATSGRRTPVADPFTLVSAVRKLWSSMPAGYWDRKPLKVGVTFTDLVRGDSVTLSLFDNERRNEEAAIAMDAIRARFGKQSIDLGCVLFQRSGSREAIAFSHVTDDGRDQRERGAFEIAKGLSMDTRSMLGV